MSKISTLPVVQNVTRNEWVELIQTLPGGGFANYKVQLSALAGLNGADGAPGAAGKSAYQVAVDAGFVGSQSAWLASLVGKSAYEVAVIGGFVGNQAAWLASLKGTPGTPGAPGTPGTPGAPGQSAYESALEGGFDGSLEEWLTSLAGTPGEDGKSAYEGAVEHGYEGTEEEFYASLTAQQGVNGGVFITDIVPVNVGENIGDKVLDTDGVSLKSCSATAQTVRVKVLALTGNTHFRPGVTVNGVTVSMVARADAPLFDGTVDITLAGPNVIAEHEDGAKWTTTVAQDLPPAVVSAVVNTPYPGTQTELKLDDTMGIHFVSDVAVVGYEVADFGCFKAATGTFTAATSGDITGLKAADRGNTAQVMGFQFRVKKANGTFSPWFTSTTAGTTELTHTLKVNNLRPTVTFGAVTYQAGQTALKGTEVATFVNAASNYDSIAYSSPNGQLTLNDAANVFKTPFVVARLAGTYNITTNNLQITASRSANGSSTTANGVVAIADAAPVITVTTPAARLRSGGNNGTAVQNYTITFTSTQALKEAPSMNAPAGTWQGAWTGNGAKTVWTRQLQVHDNDAKGTFSWNSVIATSLSNQVVSAIGTGGDYTLGGFVFRTLTVPAYPNRNAAIGTTVASTAKLRCTNLSKGSSGSLNFTYQADQTNAADRYTITGNNSWYNCDGANASSNTGGSMQIELEEVV